MALRSVVLVPPPGTGGPRRTVVLRPGGPKDKGHAIDVLACVIGILLLLSCIVLVYVLPNKQYALPQFSVTYPEAQTNSTSNRFNYIEGDEKAHVQEYHYELPDNVDSIAVTTFFEDDLPGSLPDEFRVELFDPAGNPVGIRADLFNEKPIFVSPSQDNLTQQPTFIAGQSRGRLTFAPSVHPGDEIVQGLTHTEVKEQVKARLEPQHHAKTSGTWTLRVTLVTAGDCPAPGGDSDPQQVLYCRLIPSQTPDGSDRGNPFSVENFVFTTYSVKVEDLS